MDEQIKQKLFELILWTDKVTVELRSMIPEEDYKRFREKHYENQNWIKMTDMLNGMSGIEEESLGNGYYEYMFENYIKPSIEEDNKRRAEKEA